jgi:hypothetical protein
MRDCLGELANSDMHTNFPANAPRANVNLATLSRCGGDPWFGLPNSILDVRSLLVLSAFAGYRLVGFLLISGEFR